MKNKRNAFLFQKCSHPNLSGCIPGAAVTSLARTAIAGNRFLLTPDYEDVWHDPQMCLDRAAGGPGSQYAARRIVPH